MTREEHLEAIKKADHEYYDLDTPTLSDEEYDALRKSYIEKYGAEDLDYTPGGVSGEFTAFHHTTPVISLGKVKAGETEKILAGIKKLWPAVLEPKLDGLTVVAYPDEKGVCRFVTRGNGADGEVLPNFISRYEGKPVNRTGYPVRGEVFLTRPAFDSIVESQKAAGEEPFRQIRNAAAGILRNKERSPYIDKLSYLCYDVVGLDVAEGEKMERIEKDTDFDCVKISFYETPEETVEAIQPLYDSIVESGAFPIDGIVIKTQQPDSLKRFGSTGHHPNNALAWKAETDKFTTVLRKVQWQVGRQRVTPVAVVDPVEIDGTIVTQASLANPGVIRKLGLKIGAGVTIHKSNEIIPQILSVITEGTEQIDFPETCPACGSDLREENEQLFCDNPLCAEKLAQGIAYIGSKKVLDIEGMSIETARKLVAAYPELVREKQIFSAFFLSQEEIEALPGFAKKSADKLYANIQGAAQNVDLAHFIAACAVPGIGMTVGTALMERYGTYEAVLAALNDDAEDFTAIEGIGELTAAVLHGETFRSSFRALREAVIPTEYKKDENNKPEQQLTFVITGKMEKPRSYYEEIIQKAGHKTAGSVSGNTDYLVIADTNSTSSKAKKARDLGTKLISPAELEEMLG